MKPCAFAALTARRSYSISFSISACLHRLPTRLKVGLDLALQLEAVASRAALEADPARHRIAVLLPSTALRTIASVSIQIGVENIYTYIYNIFFHKKVRMGGGVQCSVSHKVQQREQEICALDVQALLPSCQGRQEKEEGVRDREGIGFGGQNGTNIITCSLHSWLPFPFGTRLPPLVGMIWGYHGRRPGCLDCSRLRLWELRCSFSCLGPPLGAAP